MILKRTFAIAVAILCGLAAIASAQTTTTSTTLAAAITRGDTQISLTSSTGVSASGMTPVTGGYIDREYIEFTSRTDAAGTGNIWNIKRGVKGLQTPHISGATIWISVPATFDQGPNDRVGGCTAASFSFLPVIMVRTGNVLTCQNGVYTRFGSFGDTAVGTVLASTATITPVAPVTHISGTAAIVTINVPAALPDGGTISLIPDGAFTWTTAGNLVSTGTAVAGKTLVFTFDKTTNKLYPSY